jgi:uncharacterized alkaline shock family protein YloU
VQSVWRLVLFVYNLLLIIISAMAVAASLGRPEPLAYIELALSTPQNRIILGLVGVVLLIVGVFVFLGTIKLEPKPTSVEVDSSLDGEVSITIPAIKVIIMKAVKKIEGVKEIRPVVTNGANGLQVYLHMMINPDRAIPELSKKVQDEVRKYLEEIGGLKVAEVKVLVDDLNQGTKTGNN